MVNRSSVGGPADIASYEICCGYDWGVTSGTSHLPNALTLCNYTDV